VTESETAQGEEPELGTKPRQTGMMAYRRVSRRTNEDIEGQGRGTALVDVLSTLIIVFAALTLGTRLIGWRGSQYAVLMHAALPLSLLPVWLALALTGWRGQPIRFVLSALLCVAYGFSVFPAVDGYTPPAFAVGVPLRERQLRIFAANVYIENNKDIGPALLSARPDVMVLTELSKSLEAKLRRAGVFNGFGYVADNGGEGVARTVIYSRLAFANPPRIINIPGDPVPGAPLVVAEVQLADDTAVRVVGVHPYPLTVKGADLAFTATVRALQDEVRRARAEQTLMGGTPVVIAGDFNGTRWLPASGQLFDNGLTSTHEAMGYGLSASWPREMKIPRFMRLDHAFFSGPIAPLSVVDIVVPGSDHQAFVAEYVVAPQPTAVSTQDSGATVSVLSPTTSLP
jgi:endonuclease/exonuclease/phosphatase (EEP) superfamily protein YafD